MIYWDKLLIAYNRMFKTHHTTVEEMVCELYEDTQSLTQSAELLGISRYAFTRKVSKFMSLQERGGPNHRRVEEE